MQPSVRTGQFVPPPRTGTAPASTSMPFTRAPSHPWVVVSPTVAHRRLRRPNPPHRPPPLMRRPRRLRWTRVSPQQDDGAYPAMPPPAMPNAALDEDFPDRVYSPDLMKYIRQQSLDRERQRQVPSVARERHPRRGKRIQGENRPAAAQRPHSCPAKSSASWVR
jgi:hypothetical protein